MHSKLNAVIEMLSRNCTCARALSVTIILQTGGLQLQILAATAAIADARLQLQNYSVAIADSKYTLQALRPRGNRSKKQLNCNCRLQIHSAGSPPRRNCSAALHCRYTKRSGWFPGGLECIVHTSFFLPTPPNLLGSNIGPTPNSTHTRAEPIRVV